MTYDDDEQFQEMLDDMHKDYINQRDLRAMIAGKVMSGLLSTLWPSSGWEPDELVQMSVDLTDKLLERLND
jgi:hypothetical protein